MTTAFRPADRTAPAHAVPAAAVAERIAERLADPAAVRWREGIDDADRAHVMREELSTLGRGHPGISLLFNSRAANSPGDHAVAHQHLQHAARHLKEVEQPCDGLFGHVTGVGFAMAAARAATGGYGTALEALHGRIAEAARALARRTTTGAGRDLDEYDVISGLTGMGRFLLLRAHEDTTGLHEVLEALATTALLGAADGKHQGAAAPLPGFWAQGAPSARQNRKTSELTRHGHLNLGLAHGIPGPLALLALTKEQGHGSDRQSAAIERLADLLTRWIRHDEHGPYWPNYLTRDEYLSGTSQGHRRSFRWCYGTPGVARALQLAGRACGRADWQRTADDAIAAVLATPRSQWGILDTGLCHGWAGVLHLLGFFADGPHSTAVRVARDAIAATITDTFDPDTRYGHRVAFEECLAGGDYPGLLEGAAGVALALDDYAHGAHGRFPWDAALLVA